MPKPCHGLIALEWWVGPHSHGTETLHVETERVAGGTRFDLCAAVAEELRDPAPGSIMAGAVDELVDRLLRRAADAVSVRAKLLQPSVPLGDDEYERMPGYGSKVATGHGEEFSRLPTLEVRRSPEPGDVPPRFALTLDDGATITRRWVAGALGDAVRSGLLELSGRLRFVPLPACHGVVVIGFAGWSHVYRCHAVERSGRVRLEWECDVTSGRCAGPAPPSEQLRDLIRNLGDQLGELAGWHVDTAKPPAYVAMWAGRLQATARREDGWPVTFTDADGVVRWGRLVPGAGVIDALAEALMDAELRELMARRWRSNRLN